MTTDRLFAVLLFFWILAVVGFLMALSLPSQAQAIDMLPLYDNAPKVQVHTISHVTTKKHKARHKKHRAARKDTPKPDPETRVMAAQYKADAPKCLDAVRVVGSQDVRESAAEDSARKAWAEQVRWQSGESFQDIANAKDYAKRCARSSIGEALGQYFSRCEIVATPCRPAMVEGKTP